MITRCFLSIALLFAVGRGAPQTKQCPTPTSKFGESLIQAQTKFEHVEKDQGSEIHALAHGIAQSVPAAISLRHISHELGNHRASLLSTTQVLKVFQARRTLVHLSLAALLLVVLFLFMFGFVRVFFSGSFPASKHDSSAKAGPRCRITSETAVVASSQASRTSRPSTDQGLARLGACLQASQTSRTSTDQGLARLGTCFGSLGLRLQACLGSSCDTCAGSLASATARLRRPQGMLQQSDAVSADTATAVLSQKPEEFQEPWSRFWIIWTVTIINSGMIQGQALFTELFADAGVFGSVCMHAGQGKMGCTEQYAMLAGIFVFGIFMTLLFILPSGILFDRLGARQIGVWGSVICALGMFMVSGSVLGAQSGMDNLASVLFASGLLTTDFGSFLNSYSNLGLIWHFPNHQMMILSLFSAILPISALFPVVIKFLMIRIGGTLATWLALWGCLLLVTAYICWVYIPSQQEYYNTAKRVLGMPLPKPPKDVQKMIVQGLELLRLDAGSHIVCGLGMGICFSFCVIYQSMAEPFGEALFGHKSDGDEVASLYVELNGAYGLLVAPLVGTIADRLGVSILVFLLAISQLVILGTVYFASWSSQVICMSCMVLYVLLFTILIQRILLIYAPPNRFGAVSGVFFTIMTLLVIMPTVIGTAVAITSLPPSIDAYRLPYMVASALGAFSMLIFALDYRLHPPPETPHLISDDEQQLSKDFGCENLDEVAYVVHAASRKEVLHKLAKTDATSIRELFTSIDTKRMMEMMDKRSVDRIADMMEEAEESDEEEEEAAKEPPSAKPSGNVPKVPAAILELKGRIESAMNENDSPSLRKLFMEEPVSDLDRVQEWWETNRSDAENKALEKQFYKLINARQLAQMLRERKELNAMVKNMMKRELDRKFAKLRIGAK